jgi:hypothetical protein
MLKEHFMITFSMRFRAVLLTATLIGTFAMLAACKPQEVQLTFETIEQDNSPSSVKQWGGKEPKLLIMTSAQEIEEARPFVTDEALAALQ